MAELVARGLNPTEEWRRTLPAQPLTLGRSESMSIWSVPWDMRISKLHVSLSWQQGALTVRRLPEGKNKVFFKGQPLDEFVVMPGEQFVIGQTTFTLDERVSDSVTPFSELTCNVKELEEIEDIDPAQRIEALYALPGVIRFSSSEKELEERVVDVLLRGLPRARVASVVRLASEPNADQPQVEVRSLKNRGQPTEGFRPSHRLVFDAITRRRQSVMHLWQPGAITSDITVDPSCDWALCVPLPDDTSAGWGLYVAGKLDAGVLTSSGPSAYDLPRSDLKFAELVAEIFGALRQILDLQRRQALLARFLSRPVLAALAEKDMEEVLRPRQVEVSVLFCDLRGSCRIVEEGQHHLTALWARVSEALGIMASSILDQDGVVGDFHGDAAMGFWGWPLPCGDHAERAARAALTIRRRFAQAAQQPEHPLVNFTCGIGIATGIAIAGKLGTPEQFKVDVFGPTVNLASRLESMTRFFGVAILLDEVSTERLQRPNTSHWARIRKLARVQPYGMTSTILTVSELLPPVVEPGTISERTRKDYEAALEAFQNGRWDDAALLLQRSLEMAPAHF